MHLPQERHESALVLRLERLAAEQCQPIDIGRLHRIQDFAFGFFRERFAVIKTPGLRLEAVFAVIRASGHEQSRADALSVCDITVLDIAVIHSMYLPKRHSPPLFGRRIEL